MRQVKRLFYIILLNVIISAITVIVVLQLWERNHPPVSADSTPVVIVVTPTQAGDLPQNVNISATGEATSIEAGLPITGTLPAIPTVEMLTYQVKEGDTLGALAVEFNINVADLLMVNELDDPDSLYVGQIIYIPTAPLPRITNTAIPTIAVASSTPRPSATPTRGPTPTSTRTPTGQEPHMAIYTVVGAGVLENEHVVLICTGDGELSLEGWRLVDGEGSVYHFPQLTLYKGGTINLYTRSGEDTVVDLFWGLNSSIWNSGKTVSLYSAQNELRAVYTIP